MIISVIIPMFNAAPFVGEAIDSILAQSRRPDEIIVVDDGSTDESVSIVAAYGQAVRLVKQQHAGSATTVNHGLSLSRGDTIAFLDADDLWAPDKLALQCEVFEEAGSAVYAAFGQVLQFSEDPQTGARSDFSAAQAGINRDTLILRRSSFERFGLFDPRHRSSEFVPWYAKAVAQGFEARVLPQVLAYRRIHATNTGIVRRSEQQQESLGGLREALAIRRAKARANRDQ